MTGSDERTRVHRGGPALSGTHRQYRGARCGQVDRDLTAGEAHDLNPGVPFAKLVNARAAERHTRGRVGGWAGKAHERSGGEPVSRVDDDASVPPNILVDEAQAQASVLVARRRRSQFSFNSGAVRTGTRAPRAA